jgi:hypothetical protein
MSGTRNELSSQAALPQLEIVEGLHHGVRFALEDNEYVVGLNAECDIVLRDDGVLPHHAILHIEGAEARIDAVGGDVMVGNTKVAKGNGCRVRLPAKVAIGNATLQLAPPQGAHGAFGGIASIMSQPTKVAGGVIVCAVAVIVAARGLPHPEPSAAPIMEASAVDQSFSETHNAAPVTAAPMNVPQISPETTKVAADELAEKIREAGIGTLNVTSTDERIAVEGRLNDQQSPSWSSIQRWFDGKYAGAAVLTANVAIGPMAGPAPIRFQAISLGKRPYVIADNGSRYYEGAILESGWIVQRIAEDRVILKKDAESLTLSYR